MSDNADWDEVGGHVNSVTDRFVSAGWIKETLRTSEGFGIEYTAEGFKKMFKLWELLCEVKFNEIPNEELPAFRAVVNIFARNNGLL